MRFFVRMAERLTTDPQEYAAMLRHRLESIVYQQGLVGRGVLAYAFRADEGRLAIELFEVDSLENLDVLIKGDPIFSYSNNEITPVVGTVDMVREASNFLGESILCESELADLIFPRKNIRADAAYWLAYKEVRPFSPLLPEEVQQDIARRTVVSQRAHHSPIEFADDNPVGKAVGILVAEGTLEEVKAHVANCEVYPDTVVTFTELIPLERSWNHAVQELRRLCRPVTESSPFETAGVVQAGT